jgi:hypothetical protein
MADDDTVRMKVTDLKEGMLVYLLPLAEKYCPNLDYGDRAHLESEYAEVECVELEDGEGSGGKVLVIYNFAMNLAVDPEDTIEVLVKGIDS